MNTVPPVLSTERAARTARARANALHDTGLVTRFNGGDETAFTEIFSRHRESLFQVAFGLLRNWADAEEIVQDTFVRAHHALATFRGEASLHSWLHCITLNLSRNRYWYFFRRQRHMTESFERPVTPESGTTFGDLIATDNADPVRETCTREFSTLVTECMVQLKKKQQEILQLRNVRQQSYRSIAQLLGISTGTVKSRVARARKNLRTLLVEAYSNSLTLTKEAPASWFESVRPAGLLTGRTA